MSDVMSPSLRDAFRALCRAHTGCAWLLSTDLAVLERTAAVRRIFGALSDEEPSTAVFPPLVTSATSRALLGETIRLDLPVSSDGTSRIFELIAQPVAEDGIVVAVLIQGYDVTDERHRVQEGALLARIALTVGQIENVTDAIEATLQHICDATGWLLGEAWIPRVSGVGTPVLEHGGLWTSEPQRLEPFVAQMAGFRFMRGEGIPGTAWASGVPLWVHDLQRSESFTRGPLAALAGLTAAVAIPLVHADGEIVAVLVFFMRDVRTDNTRLVQLASAVSAPLAQLLRQKQSEEAHRVAEARFAGMVSIASDAIICINTAREITLFNWGAERIFGYTAAEAIGQLLDMLLPEELRSRHAAHIMGFAASADTTRRMGERSRIVGLRKNGDVFPAEASISRFLNHGEWVFTVILRDISERVRAEEELRVLADRMRQAAASRDEVMALVSHDLRNPLSTIEICLSGLRDEPPPPPNMAAELVTLAQESATLMSRMIQDLLDIASIDAERLSIERVPQPVPPILARAVEMHRMIAAEQHITLSLDIPATIREQSVDADAERIVQVLSNLIGNACKFTRAGGHVSVSAQALPAAIQITVRDTGQGIPVDAIPHVFDRFWHARRGAAQRSTGLGLAIVKGIVEAHDGRIWVESTVGAGSAFHFTLPESDAVAPGPSSASGID
jgi:PAS domain S-box-containing protein